MLRLNPARAAAAAAATAAVAAAAAAAEVDWFDAHSSFHSHVEDHADLLAQLDQALPVTTTLPAQPCSLGLQHGCPWVPDPPLMFAGEAGAAPHIHVPQHTPSPPEELAW